MKISLPSTISSPQEVTSLINDVQQFMTWHAQSINARKVSAAYAEPQPQIAPAATELLRSVGGEKDITEKQLDELLAVLEQLAKDAPVMTITLAAPVSVAAKRTLVEKCRTAIHPDVLVTFQFNASLLGGMVVRTGSSIFDWSFRRALLEQKTQFTEVLDRV